MDRKNQNKDKHTPVLLTKVLQVLDPKKGETYLDLTAGYGGHAMAVTQLTRNYKGCVLVDRDIEAVKSLQTLFQDKGARIIHSDFLSASESLQGEGQQFDLVLADLGVSSPHLDKASRGFSFAKDGPLDMRMDQTQALSAHTIVNSYSEALLSDLILRYGEEPKARQIARRIVVSRPIETTAQLATIVAKAWPGHSKVHPATRTFQALRIAVNNELELLRLSLPIWKDLLKPGGRMVIISFHSLEDRLVKQFLKEHSGNNYDAELRLIGKQPAIGDSQEIALNPRARSAKLRAAVKIKT
jgi:16S rRNA (cytosine1402-N4)-methyltransferase